MRKRVRAVAVTALGAAAVVAGRHPGWNGYGCCAVVFVCTFAASVGSQ